MIFCGRQNWPVPKHLSESSADVLRELRDKSPFELPVR
jgi:hypothetical protein